MLQLQSYDGSLFPRLYLVARPPSMLPTVQLTTNKTEQDTSAVNQQAGSSNRRRSFTKRGLLDGTGHSGPKGLWKRWVEKWRVD